MTELQRKQEFLADLKALMQKHDAELDIEFHRPDLGASNMVTLNAEYDKDGNCIKPFTQFYIGQYIRKDHF